MAKDSFQEKTEKPTPRRREQARDKGQVARSREIPSVLILMTSLAVFFLAGTWMFWSLSALMGVFFQNLSQWRIDSIDAAGALMFDLGRKIFTILAPFLLVVLVAGIAANVAQVGFYFKFSLLTPKFSKLNPLSGLKKFVSLKALVEVFKSVAKILVIGSVAYLAVMADLESIPALIQLPVVQILTYIGHLSAKICFYTALVMIFLSILDYVYQRWEHEKTLRMTKQEIKDESKQTDGDPKVKARIRSIQLEMSRRRMMDAIPEADVVITNPTHLAVALKFDGQSMAAPTVVAKGAGHLATKIKDIARSHAVPVIENKPLAQALMKAVEIGQAIPAELYKAVAEILAYVYRMKGSHPGV